MKKHWLYYISPCTIAAVFLLLALIDGVVDLGGPGWVLVWPFVLLWLLVLGLGFIIKTLTKGNVLYIWIFESILVALAAILIKIALS
jgi:hypothetical protein